MPSLTQMAQDAEKVLRRLAMESSVRANRAKWKKRARQPRLAQAERDIAVMFGLNHGWSDRLIGERFHLSRNTVVRTRRKFEDSPQSMFFVPILHRDVVNNRQVWRCEVCLDRMLGSERKARLHVANHFGITRDSYRRNGILDEDRLDWNLLTE